MLVQLHAYVNGAQLEMVASGSHTKRPTKQHPSCEWALAVDSAFQELMMKVESHHLHLPNKTEINQKPSSKFYLNLCRWSLTSWHRRYASLAQPNNDNHLLAYDPQRWRCVHYRIQHACPGYRRWRFYKIHNLERPTCLHPQIVNSKCAMQLL